MKQWEQLEDGPHHVADKKNVLFYWR